MKDWITIGQLAQKTGLTARALRLYEAKGLLKSHSRGDNDYRFYSKSEVLQALQIKNFKDLGFTLGEIAELLAQDPSLTTANLQNSLKKKLKALKAEHLHAVERIRRLENLIASLNNAHKLSEPQRRIIMEELVTQAKENIKARGVKLSPALEDSLRYELSEIHNSPYKVSMDLLDIIKQIADDMGIQVGPGRGHAAGSLLLFAKGFNHNHSRQFGLMPELFFHYLKALIWIDVDYDSGPEFLNRLLQRTTLEALREAKIYIFQCPFLSLMAQVEKQVGPIDFDAIPDNDPLVLRSFAKDQIENIFLFDAPDKSIMHANGSIDFWKKENELKRKLWQFLENYKVKDVEDILALCTTSFPFNDKELGMEQYVHSETMVPDAEKLPAEIRKILAKTKGLLLYREDYIRILQVYLDWSVAEANQFYGVIMKRQKEFARSGEYELKVPADIRAFLDANVKGVFFKSHMVCMWWFIKRSAVMNSLYPKEYLAALKDWTNNHHSAWSDLGFIDKDFRPLALYF